MDQFFTLLLSSNQNSSKSVHKRSNLLITIYAFIIHIWVTKSCMELTEMSSRSPLESLKIWGWAFKGEKA